MGLRRLIRKLFKTHGLQSSENGDRRYEHFQEFLIRSITDPVFRVPFSKGIKRNFAFMENIASFLISSSNKKSDEDLCSVILIVEKNFLAFKKSLQSVLDQNYKNFEILIITHKEIPKEALKDLNGKEKVHIVAENKIFNKYLLINEGIKRAKGENLYFLEEGNTWDRRYLKVMQEAFKLNGKAEALYCAQYRYLEEEPFLAGILFGSYNKSLLENRNYIDLNSFGCKKEVIINSGMFRLLYPNHEDWDLFLRISILHTIYSIPVLLVHVYRPFIKIDTLRNEAKKNLPPALYPDIKSNSLSRGVSAIIPNYELAEDLKECVFSLLDQINEIIVVDNCSSKEVKKCLADLAKNQKVKIIYNQQNYGYSFAVNQGLALAKKDNDILLVNNDSIYLKNAVYWMQRKAYESPQVGLVAPRQILYPHSPYAVEHVPFCNNERYCDISLSYHLNNIKNPKVFSNGEDQELSFASFFSVYLKREVFQQAGFLDAEHGRHGVSDIIYCEVINLLLLKKIIYEPRSLVLHKFNLATNFIANNKKNIMKEMVKNNSWNSVDMKRLGYTKKQWQ